MVTVIVFDGFVHHKHPHKENKTFCGKNHGVLSDDDITKVASFATPAEFASSTVARKENVRVCDDCLEKGEEWATPDDV